MSTRRPAQHVMEVEVSDEVSDKSTRVNEVRRARYYTVTRSLRRSD
jgi:hypothetical protein